MTFARTGVLAVLVASVVFAATGVAFAYPNEAATYPEGLPRTECVDCHAASEQDILEPGADPVLLAAVRKGPHGGYATGGAKCQVCHSVHDAPSGGTKLLPAATIKDTCESCHDGTGGIGVYGSVLAQTGEEPASAHRVEATSTIPGGAVAGGPRDETFGGPDGTLTCGDCHSPHDSATVEPFAGDRLRSAVASDSAYAAKTNRLLRQAPTGATTTVAVYGAGWCAACHAGRLTQHDPGSGVVQTHPVMQDDTYYYDRVPVVLGVASYETTLGSLGQSNRGYVMPDDPAGDPLEKTVLQEGNAPICQQCHEDARDVGPTSRETNPRLTSAAQEFQVTAYGGVDGDNPGLQAFPHESSAPSFLVRPPTGGSDPYLLCLSCHPLTHDATLGSDYVLIFEDGDHDDAQPPGDPYDVYVDCDICHSERLLDVHAQQCLTCHPDPFGSLDPWTNGCQEGGCHTVFHADSTVAHLPWSGTGGGQCGFCHTPGIGPPNQSKCANCHAVFSPSDTSPPVTTSDAVASYVGAGIIDYTITEGGKVGVGTTFSRLDGGDAQVGSTFLVDSPGSHSLEFWSVDQAGNVESPSHTVAFTVATDTVAPVTTSNAQASYFGIPANITLSATDASTLGVKTTYYSLNGGPTQTGTSIYVPALPGEYDYTLDFWSEDYSGNVETTNTAEFTVTGGTGTIRLIWWPSPGPGDWADWTVRRGGSSGPIVATGSGAWPGWDGIDDVVVTISATDYYVLVGWGTSEEPYDETVFPSVEVTTHGQIVTLYY